MILVFAIWSVYICLFALQMNARSGVGPTSWVAGPAVAIALNYLTTETLPISVPITSPETTSSTRRFSWRPLALSLEATGWVSPNPLVVTEPDAIPCPVRPGERRHQPC